MSFQYVDIEFCLWRLFQKRVMRTKFNIYNFIAQYSIVQNIHIRSWKHKREKEYLCYWYFFSFKVYCIGNAQHLRLGCCLSWVRGEVGSIQRLKLLFANCPQHAAVRSKIKDWLARNQVNVSEWGDMTTCGLLFFHWASNIKVLLVSCSRHAITKRYCSFGSKQ